MEILIPALIVVGLLLTLGIFLAYSHYIKTEKIKQLSGTNTDLTTAVEAHQLDTLTWNANAYRHSADFLKSERDDELDTNVPYYLMMEDVHKHMSKLKFKKVRSYVDQYDDGYELWVGELFKTHVSVRLQYGCTHEGFVDWEPQKNKQFYLIGLQVVHPNPEKCAELLMDKFKTSYRRAVREKQKVSETTSVYEFAINPIDQSYFLRRRNTRELFKYGRVFSECPEMFSHIKWTFDGEEMDGFDGKLVAEQITFSALKSPRVNGGILFGAPGTGKTSFLNGLAFMLGKNSGLKVILVNGSTMDNPVKMTALATSLANEVEAGNRPVILINEGDSLLALDKDGEKTTASQILMGLMDNYPVYLSCNKDKSKIHEAFYREGRGSFLFYVGNLTESQIEPVNAYVKQIADEEESLIFMEKKFDSAPTLAQLFSQLKLEGWEEFKAKLKGNFAVKVVNELATEPSESEAVKVAVKKFNGMKKFHNRKGK